MNSIIDYNALVEKKNARDRVRGMLTGKTNLEQYIEDVHENQEAYNDVINKHNEIIVALKDEIAEMREIIALYEKYIALLGRKITEETEEYKLC